MRWFFQQLSLAQVETEITQRDQFSNDTVTLTETIVREAVQNSLDAADEPSSRVKVTFRWMEAVDGLDGSYFRDLLGEQTEHAKQAGLAVDEIDFNAPNALVIEDFGTTGLTGSTHSKDNDHFSDFWRRHGKSHKSGKSRGRWGLGKLVYSTASRSGVFFGLTKRKNDDRYQLMGQSVLNLYELNGKQYLPHSFFADQTSPDDIFNNLPVPVEDNELVMQFYDTFQLNRHGRSGLSVVIPFPENTLDFNSMIRIAIDNYFYPIVTDQLTLIFNSVEINRGTIRQLAIEYGAQMYSQLDELFDFIEAASRTEEVLTLRDSWSDDNKLGESDFDKEDLDTLIARFGNGELCGVRLPLSLEKKLHNGRRGDAAVELIKTYVSAFIQRPANIESGLDLYVRGGLTLPEECKFKNRLALSVMIADDEDICDFLGNAENPAHTKWNLSPEKLKKKYRNPSNTVRVIKNALVNLYGLLADAEEIKDDKVLGRFFAMANEPANTSKTRGGKDKEVAGQTPGPENPNPPVSKKLINVSRMPGGFRLSSVDGVAEDSLPAKFKVRLAYSNGKSNPFKGYSPHDFTVGKGGNININISSSFLDKFSQHNKLISSSQNEIQFVVSKVPFTMDASGFDESRDLVVDVRKLRGSSDADGETS